MPSSDVFGHAQRSFSEWLLLDQEAAARALPAERRARAVALHKAGETRVDAALGSRGVPALLLARGSIPFFLRAMALAAGRAALPESSTLEELWAEYDALVDAGAAPKLPPALLAERERTAATSPDAEIRALGEPLVDEAVALATFLADGVEVRTPSVIRLHRAYRILLAVFALVLAFTFVRRVAPRGTNRALHASASLSSHRGAYGPPGDLTNGKIAPESGIATNDEPDPWAEVDLGSVMRVSEVTVMGADEHEHDNGPLRVETSRDRVLWETAGTEGRGFTASDPAVISFRARDARFVRIHGKPGGTLYLHEVEVR
jgi:hypothetical protein